MKKKMIKILVLDHFNQIGGGQLYILDILCSINHNNYHVFTIDSPVDKLNTALQKSDVTVLPIVFKGWKDFLKPWRIVKNLICLISAVKKHNIDIIHTNTVWCQCLAIGIKILCQRPILWNYHDFAQFDWLGNWFKILLASAANRIVVPSYASAKKLKISSDKISIIGNGFDLNKFKPASQRRTDDKFVIAWIGRLIPWKNAECLLYAAEILQKRGINAEFQIYGDGHPEYISTICSLINKLKINETVSLQGYVADIQHYISESDIVVNTSIKPESFGRTFIEAALCKKAVIATELGASLEVVLHKQTGILIPCDNPSALADAILYMINNPLKRKQMAEFAFQRAKDLFSLDNIVNRIENLYISLSDE
ncbi:MAG: glycosyltransferase family 4 protein [Desulfobacteraceae bacterium]|nr:glycosyltransferase family 4 protein [Desulfobacteraceae bacterium]